MQNQTCWSLAALRKLTSLHLSSDHVYLRDVAGDPSTNPCLIRQTTFRHEYSTRIYIKPYQESSNITYTVQQ